MTKKRKKIKKSVLLAFHRLLQAAKYGDHVFLLRDSDTNACHAMGQYCELADGEAPGTAKYVQFARWVRQMFEQRKASGTTYYPRMLRPEELKEAERILSILTDET